MKEQVSWRRRRSLTWVLRGILSLILVIAIALSSQLYRHAQQPTDAILVLGGSIKREMHVAEVAKALPDVPILISGGSDLPCISLIFERVQTPLDQVYSDRCAQNTWGNFYHSTPILRSWQAHHVRLITSASHLPRALWMARLHLGVHGIWVEPDIVIETGQPGNQERSLKTVLDLIRTLGSALWSLREPAQPHCPLKRPPASRDFVQWQRLKPGQVHCEHQAGLDAAVEQWQQELHNYRQQQNSL
ncbi:MAG: YdcF family protein [Spirulina sp. SIO3F2]|nr:YdcF family protein [Spirulina sp. SIO3F2]